MTGAPSFLEPGTRDELAEIVRAAMRDRIPLRVTGRAQPAGPIAAGARTERTWTVCVDAWRVPLGMHIETRDVSVRWE